MREILILRKPYGNADDVAVFATFDRKIGWFQHDYAEPRVGDITRADVTLITEDGMNELPVEIRKDPLGIFMVVE